MIIVLGLGLLSAGLGGCASINSHLAAAMDDHLPQWAGGLPPDAPPRPGTAAYDQEMKRRQAQEQNMTAKPATGASSDAVR
ncbi:MAG TPA: hypothetical protein VHC94_11170 [Nitrobacter sp.]|nr:hypothetical protein [Nitrobacter sp.]